MISFDHIENPSRRDDAIALDRLFQDVTGWRPKLWGKIVGYGRYHYVYASGREGDSFATGFTMRARDISLHILPGYTEFPEITARLGKHKRGRACWYVTKLADIDHAALSDLIRAGLDDLSRQYSIAEE